VCQDLLLASNFGEFDFPRTPVNRPPADVLGFD
jgi:hypothetical protein